MATAIGYGLMAHSRSTPRMAAFWTRSPFGAVMNKGLTIRTGQTHVNRYASHARTSNKRSRRGT
jgi:hypothetical protein